MAFRRRRDEWDEFLSRHGAELRACGIPDYVVAKKMRFLVFLDHGYDEWGWAENHHAFFDARVLPTSRSPGWRSWLVVTSTRGTPSR